MLAFAMHLFRTLPGLQRVTLHPDGEHGKQFEIREWLAKRGYELTTRTGKTEYGGTYQHTNGTAVTVHPCPGLGDVETEYDGFTIVAECKGGIINTSHAGQVSRLRRGLCEAVGLSLGVPMDGNLRQYAVVPRTKHTEALAKRIADRVAAAGVEIALVDARGDVFDVPHSNKAKLS